ncbi:unnamed protein product, partial [Symbiodinium necroappetens]
MFKDAASKIRKQRSAADAFVTATEGAVSPENTPGRSLDVTGDSAAARAARALQEVVQGGTATDHAKVISYKEDVFRRIRLQFGRSQEQYNASLSEGPLRLVGEEEASGKSCAFFVFSEDGRYCVKRIDAKEARMLLSTVDDYEAYIHKHTGTLLPRFYGLYEVRLYSTRSPIWLMVQ